MDSSSLFSDTAPKTATQPPSTTIATLFAEEAIVFDVIPPETPKVARMELMMQEEAENGLSYIHPHHELIVSFP
ncbi:hypothetical protein HY256_02880, partial [Candidatus Sumerlaeota bacterium]|nr:hypothetical protein [Candidatus Sumerlaeota bacterium]